MLRMSQFMRYFVKQITMFVVIIVVCEKNVKCFVAEKKQILRNFLRAPYTSWILFSFGAFCHPETVCANTRIATVVA